MSTLPLAFLESTLGTDLNIDDINHNMGLLNNWTDRYRQLFKLANELIPLPEDYKNASYLVEGCENAVWLHHYFDQQSNKHYFMADSESKIIKGLLVIILSSCNQQSSSTILAVDLNTILQQLDFGRYLTPSRTNGLLSVMDKIKGYCQ
ncbi:MAG: cysteine desulfuration protein SufE [Enterobacterales bacterium]|jgi:cysteine desulfuration protein SufE